MKCLLMAKIVYTEQTNIHKQPLVYTVYTKFTQNLHRVYIFINWGFSPEKTPVDK